MKVEVWERIGVKEMYGCVSKIMKILQDIALLLPFSNGSLFFVRSRSLPLSLLPPSVSFLPCLFHINVHPMSVINVLTAPPLDKNLSGLFTRACMKAQAASPSFTNVYAALIAIVNTKFPQNGELALKRLVLQTRRAFRRNDKVRETAGLLEVAMKACWASVSVWHNASHTLYLIRIINSMSMFLLLPPSSIAISLCLCTSLIQHLVQPMLLNSVKFIAHLINQKVVYSLCCLLIF